MQCDIFPSVLWHCWLGNRKGIRPVKNWVLFCWWWRFDRSFARLIAPVFTITSIMLCFSKHRLTQVHLENGQQNGERRSFSCQDCHFRRLSLQYHQIGLTRVKAKAKSPMASGLSHTTREWPSSPFRWLWVYSEPTLQPSGEEHSLTWAVGHTSHHAFCHLPS